MHAVGFRPAAFWSRTTQISASIDSTPPIGGDARSLGKVRRRAALVRALLEQSAPVQRAQRVG